MATEEYMWIRCGLFRSKEWEDLLISSDAHASWKAFKAAFEGEKNSLSKYILSDKEYNLLPEEDRNLFDDSEAID